MQEIYQLTTDHWHKAILLLSLANTTNMKECLSCGDWMIDDSMALCGNCGTNWIAF